MRILTISTAIVVMAAIPAIGQTTARPDTKTAAPKAAAAKAYKTPKTAWGDPDLQGIYTNKDESGIPFERPSEFEGKKTRRCRRCRAGGTDQGTARNGGRAAAPQLGGAAPAPGRRIGTRTTTPRTAGRGSSSIRPDGRIPPLTPEAQARIAAMPPAAAASPTARGNSPADFSLYDRCITRGIPGSMMPAIYGNSYQIVQAPGLRRDPLRDDPRDAHHPARRPPASDAEDPQRDGRRPRPLGRQDARRRDHQLHSAIAYRNADSATFKLIERFTPVGRDKIEWAVTSTIRRPGPGRGRLR